MNSINKIKPVKAQYMNSRIRDAFPSSFKDALFIIIEDSIVKLSVITTVNDPPPHRKAMEQRGTTK